MWVHLSSSCFLQTDLFRGCLLAKAGHHCSNQALIGLSRLSTRIVAMHVRSYSIESPVEHDFAVPCQRLSQGIVEKAPCGNDKGRQES